MFCSTCSLSLVCCHQPVSNFFKVSLKLFKICYDVNFSCNADGYDSMDPNGNITIKWDILQANGGTEDVSFFLLKIHFVKMVNLFLRGMLVLIEVSDGFYGTRLKFFQLLAMPFSDVEYNSI